MNASPVVVVTGSSACPGCAIAYAFAKRGAGRGISARNFAALQAAQRECERLGSRSIFIPAKIPNAETIQADCALRKRAIDASRTTAVCTAVILFAGRKLIAGEPASAAKQWQ